MNKNILVKILLLLFITYSSHVMAYDDDEKNAHFSAVHLEKSLKLQTQMQKLDEGYRELAMISSGGILNSKLGSWGQAEVNSGKLKKSEFFYIMSLSLMKLSSLAQTFNMNKISVCHMNESRILMSMAKGKLLPPANCRQEAYGNDMQVRATRKAHGSLSKEIRKLTNEWATAVVMYSQYAAELDNYGRLK